MRRPLLFAVLAPALANAQLSEITPISPTPHGYPTGATSDVGLSNGGRYAAMATNNPSLLLGDTPGTPDVVVIDRLTRLFTRASEVQPLDTTPYEYANVFVSNDGSTLYYSRQRPGAKPQACRYSTVTNAVTYYAADRVPIAATRDGLFAAFQSSTGDVRIYDAAAGALRSVASYINIPNADVQFRAMNATGSVLAVRSRLSLIPTEADGGNFLVTRWGKPTRIPDLGLVTSISATGRYVGILTPDSHDARDTNGVDAYRYDMQTGAWLWLSDFSGRDMVDPQTSRLTLSESGMVAGFTSVSTFGETTFGRRTTDGVALPLGDAIKYRPDVPLSDSGDTFVLVEGGLYRFPFDYNPDSDAFFTMIGNLNRFGLSYGFAQEYARVHSMVASSDGRYVYMGALEPFNGVLSRDNSGAGTLPLYISASHGERVATDATGRFFAFSALAAAGHLELYDRQLGTLNLISRGTAGELNAPSTEPAVSPDGNYVAFQSTATNMETGQNGSPQIYLYDTRAKTLWIVSRYRNGNLAPYGVHPAFTGDSKGLIFVSDPRLAPGYESYRSPATSQRVFHFDLVTGVLRGAPPSSFVDPASTLNHGVLLSPVPDATGTKVYFNDLNEDGGGVNYIRVWDLATNKASRILGDGESCVTGIAPEGDTLVTMRRKANGGPRLYHLPTRSWINLPGIGGVPFAETPVGASFAPPVTLAADRRIAYIPQTGPAKGYAYQARYAVPSTP